MFWISIIWFTFQITSIQGSSSFFGRNLQQQAEQPILSDEQIRLVSGECNPSQQATGDCANFTSNANQDLEECDEIAPSGLFDCKWYATNGACSGLNTTFCRTSCNRCGCEDVEFPGLECSFVVSSNLCTNPEIVQEKYCQKSCGLCGNNQNDNLIPNNVRSNNVNIDGTNNTVNAASGTSSTTTTTTTISTISPLQKSKADVLFEFTLNIPKTSTSLFNWIGQSPCDDWSGITCENGQITEIRLRQILLVTEKLQNSIPSEFSTFENLKLIDFSDMQVTGTLPPELSTLVNLENIDIQKNSIMGKIPNEYSTWTLLKFAQFNENQFNGSLPKQFSTWKQIKEINFGQCELFGSLPREYSVFNNFKKIIFDSNQLRGTLPVEYSAMNTFEILSLNSNFLTGSLPPEYSAMSGLKLISLESNFLTGSLPLEYSIWGKDVTAYFRDNILTGRVPIAFSALKDLFVFQQKQEATLCIVYGYRTSFASHFYSVYKLC